jgi:TatD DNase family protein
MTLIDTHAHIYLPEFEQGRREMLHESHEKDVHKILMPAIDAQTHQAMLEVAAAHANCLPMMGLHPCSVNAEFQTELQIVEEWLARRPFIAVGEIGLDFHWDKTFVRQQFDAFHAQVLLALKYDLPIVIHSRNATDECIEVVRQYPGLKGVFHCFSGTLEQAEEVISLGFLLGIGGVVTFKNAGLDAIIASVGIDQVVLETDAPYLAPVPFRGKQNSVTYLPLIAEKISQVTKLQIEEVAKITTQNAINLFKLS